MRLSHRWWPRALSYNPYEGWLPRYRAGPNSQGVFPEGTEKSPIWRSRHDSDVRLMELLKDEDSVTHGFRTRVLWESSTYLAIASISLAVLFGFLYTFSLVAAGPARWVKRDPIPNFVLEKAPLSHLWSQESWWPSDVAVHLTHVEPQVNFTSLATAVTFENISTLPKTVFLTAIPSDAVLTQPDWLTSAENMPDSNGISSAPATIICVEKPGGIIDAFYFYFYSFNAGGKVLGIEFDNHVGDWEHSMVRFVDGIPQFIYLSAHTGGTAYTYDTLNTTNGRATTFIAGGTHANYATGGPHFHDLPPPLLADETDNGLLWDVTANFRGYWFDNTTQTFHAAGGAGAGATEQANEGVGWLMFAGMWGDEQYPLTFNDQYCIFDQCHFMSGPTGPIAKNLGRHAVCQRENNCSILTSLP